MLPDWPEIKQELADLQLRQTMKAAAEKGPIAAELPHFVMHEGDKMTFETADGDIRELELERVEAKYVIPLDSVSSQSLEAALKHASDMGSQMAKQMSDHLLATLDEAVGSAGNVVDAGGRGFSFLLLLQLFEKLQVDFDDFEQPYLPTMLVPPKMTEVAGATLRAVSEDRVLSTLWMAALSKKREEWRARESHRKLVD
jgi:hypothetical protein